MQAQSEVVCARVSPKRVSDPPRAEYVVIRLDSFLERNRGPRQHVASGQTLNVYRGPAGRAAAH